MVTLPTHECLRSMVTYDKWIYKSNPKFPTPEKVGRRKDTILDEEKDSVFRFETRLFRC